MADKLLHRAMPTSVVHTSAGQEIGYRSNMADAGEEILSDYPNSLPISRRSMRGFAQDNDYMGRFGRMMLTLLAAAFLGFFGFIFGITNLFLFIIGEVPAEAIPEKLTLMAVGLAMLCAAYYLWRKGQAALKREIGPVATGLAEPLHQPAPVPQSKSTAERSRPSLLREKNHDKQFEEL